MKNLFTILSLICALFIFQVDASASNHGQTSASTSSQSSNKASNKNDNDFIEGLDDEDIEVSDPIEPVNRAMFWFNDKLYFYLLKPIAKGYRFVVPERGRTKIANFFSNIATPIRAVNALFQGKFQDARNETGRFMFNSTVGILGFFDPAKDHLGVYKKDEDFGQTLGHYGSGSGFYIVIPVLGPSNVRDGFGLIVDTFLDPVAYMEPGRDAFRVKFFEAVNAVSLDKDTYEGIVRDELDPYLFVRDAYAQHRAGKIKK